MNLRLTRALPMAAALIAVAALFGACTATDPRLEDEPVPATAIPTAATALRSAPIGSAHVILTVRTAAVDRGPSIRHGLDT